jgi:transcriptional regulator
MYIPAAFRENRLEVLHAHIREHSFGTLVSQVSGELFATHLPFLLDENRGPNGTLLGHMARANPHWQGFRTGVESLVIFQGPHAYISPGWYVSEQSVPTWNYTVVHAYGSASLMEHPQRVRELLERTVRTFEGDAPEAWSTARVDESYITNLARGIVAFELPIARLEGKRKLAQNRPAADVEGAATGLRARGDPLGLAVADLMSQAAERRSSSPG